MAFLALEVSRLGRPETGTALLQHFRTLHDPAASDALVHFYMSVRATMRAKVSAWHVGDPQFPDPRPWLRRTRSYLRDAARHARIALALLAGERSVPRGPMLQQRRQRLAARDAPHR
jgi:aminoglycoside phosphotransferase family enzyme